MAAIAFGVALAALLAQPGKADGDADSSSSGGLSPTAVGVLIVGCVVVLALLAILVWFLRRRDPKRSRTQAMEAGRATAAARGDTSPAFFMTAFSPPSSSYGKNADAYSGGVNVDARANHDRNPRIKAPYAPFGRPGRPAGGEPLLYNREATTTLRINDSTRSYLYEPTASPDHAATDVDVTPKIYSSKNSVDFTYVDTDRSNLDLVDSTPTALREFNELHDSSRSDPYGFVVESNNSSRVFSVGDDDSARSSRLGFEDNSARSSRLAFEDDSSRSSRPYSDTSARTTVFNEELATNKLNTQERRNIKVEL